MFIIISLFTVIHSNCQVKLVGSRFTMLFDRTGKINVSSVIQFPHIWTILKLLEVFLVNTIFSLGTQFSTHPTSSHCSYIPSKLLLVWSIFYLKEAIHGCCTYQYQFCWDLDKKIISFYCHRKRMEFPMFKIDLKVSAEMHRS